LITDRSCNATSVVPAVGTRAVYIYLYVGYGTWIMIAHLANNTLVTLNLWPVWY